MICRAVSALSILIISNTGANPFGPPPIYVLSLDSGVLIFRIVFISPTGIRILHSWDTRGAPDWPSRRVCRRLFLFTGPIGNLTFQSGPYFSLGEDTILDVFILRWIICLARVNFIIIILVTWRTSASWCARGHNKTNIILTIVFFSLCRFLQKCPRSHTTSKVSKSIIFCLFRFLIVFYSFQNWWHL